MLKNLINGLVINEGDGTPLYDAIYKGARLARKDATNDRRVVIVMTDGVDSDRQGNVEKGSTIYDRNSIIEELRQLNVPVFTVGLGDEIDSAFLQRVANTTGGTYQNAPQGSDLARIFTEVAAGLKIKYDLGLESRTVSDGGLHNLTIEARTPFGDVSGSTQYLANYPIVPWVQGVQAANPRQDFRASTLSRVSRAASSCSRALWLATTSSASITTSTISWPIPPPPAPGSSPGIRRTWRPTKITPCASRLATWPIRPTSAARSSTCSSRNVTCCAGWKNRPASIRCICSLS